MTVQEKLIGIYFKQCYSGFGVVTDEELNYIKNNDFVCVVTDETKNNSYDIESNWIKRCQPTVFLYPLSLSTHLQENLSIQRLLEN